MWLCRLAMIVLLAGSVALEDDELLVLDQHEVDSLVENLQESAGRRLPQAIGIVPVTVGNDTAASGANASGVSPWDNVNTTNAPNSYEKTDPWAKVLSGNKTASPMFPSVTSEQGT